MQRSREKEIERERDKHVQIHRGKDDIHTQRDREKDRHTKRETLIQEYSENKRHR